MSGEPDPATRASRATGGDYALLNASYLVGLGALAWSASQADPERLSALEAGEFVLATFALADSLAHEKIAHWIREPFVEETTDHRPARPRGSGLRYAVGELLSCSRCVGTWSALGLMSLRLASPPAARAVTSVLAAAGANGFAQAGFRLICDRTNQLEESG